MERACGPVLQAGFGAGGHLAVCGTFPPDDISASECTGAAAVPLAGVDLLITLGQRAGSVVIVRRLNTYFSVL